MTVLVTVWERFADVVLAREAALCRLVSGVPPRDFAGLSVGDEDLDRVLRSLPGLDGPDANEAAPIRDRFATQFDTAQGALKEWLEAGDEPLAAIARRARLDLAATEVLALLSAVEVDPQRQRLVTYIQDSIQLPRVTLSALTRLLGPGHPGPLTVAPGSRLRDAALVEVDATGPWAIRGCSVAAAVVWAILGSPPQDPELPPSARLRAPGGQRVGRASRAGPDPADGSLVLIHGADAESRRRAAHDCFAGRPLLITREPVTDAAWDAVIRTATIAAASVVVEMSGPIDAGVAGHLERASHLTFALSSRTELPLESLPDLAIVELPIDDGEADDDDWLAELGTTSIGQPRLSREQLRLVSRAAGGDPSRVGAGVRRLAGGHLDGLAVRIRARRQWADVVLPAPQHAQLREIVARYRRRRTVFGEWGFPTSPSCGVVALFAGPSGTGKTLAAEVAASELGLDLYKVDLAAVVSKYIGETEKNLERIFSAAAAGDLVLFFDEADALFGKRSEVSNAHDRYANIEVAYLLQRLEAFDGLVILATNLQRNIDEAFLRRIGVSISFTAPDEQRRRRIWELAFPVRAPIADLDLDFLARQFEVTGGTIRNAALGAAFMAAEHGTSIAMEEVVLAMHREFVKLGHLATDGEFERYADIVRVGR